MLRRVMTGVILSVLLSLSVSVSAEERYGLFLVDQSASMTIPAEAPRFQRALDKLTYDLGVFVAAAEAAEETAYVKIVTFNDDTGYVARTDWLPDTERVRNVVDALYEETGWSPGPVGDALCRALFDPAFRTVSPTDRTVFLYSDSADPAEYLGCNPKLIPEHFRKGESHPIRQMAQAAQWRVTFYESTMDALVRTKRAGAVEALEDATLPDASVRGWQRLTAGSRSTLSRIPDPDHSSEPAGSHADKSGTNTFYQYFSVGKYTDKIKVNRSTDSFNWTPAELGNNAKTRASVSAVRFNGHTYVFYIGKTVDKVYYSYSSDGINWFGNTTLSNTVISNIPRAFALGDHIKVFYTKSDNSVWYTSYYPTNGSGALTVLPEEDTGITDSNSLGVIPGFYDELSNKEVILVGRKFWDSDPDANDWSERHNLGHFAANPDFTKVGNDVWMTYGWWRELRLVKQSESWALVTLIHDNVKSSGALGHTDRHVAVFLDQGNTDIKSSQLSPLGGWTAPVQVTEQTYIDVDMVAWSEAIPLSGSISGDHSGSVGDQLSWTASAQCGTAPYTYSWAIDGLSLGTGANFSQAFFSPGTYLLSMTVTDSAGATATSSRYIAVFGEDCVGRACILQ